MTPELNQYLETALWSSLDDAGQPLDLSHGPDDFCDTQIDRAARDLSLFLTKASHLIDGLDLTDVAHDFWLTRNRHGAGFWDGDYTDDVGNQLTQISHSFRELSIYEGDDGRLYFE